MMKQLRSLLAPAVLTLALAATAVAGDGIIHTGNTAPPPTSFVTDDAAAGGETTQGEATALDLTVEAALNCLQGTFTLF